MFVTMLSMRWRRYGEDIQTRPQHPDDEPGGEHALQPNSRNPSSRTRTAITTMVVRPVAT